MPLTLAVLRCPPSVAPELREVTGGEFSIGRGPENDWVLADPDKYLSKRHCVIAYRKGAWQVAGTSVNGTFVNSDRDPLESQSPHMLEDGDRLRLGAYEIEVRLVEEARSAWGAPAPGAGRSGARPSAFDDPFGDDPFAAAPPAGRIMPLSDAEIGTPRAHVTLPPSFDPLAPDEPDDIFTGPTQSDHSATSTDAMNLPRIATALPDDWDLDTTGTDRRQPAPPISPPPVVAPPVAPAVITPPPPAAALPPAASPPGAQGGDLLAAFLRGVGMPDIQLRDPMRTMEQLGATFRATVSGIRRALIARGEVKRAFRVEATEIRTSDNNLLKFSVDDNDALAGLLGTGRPADMSPPEAIADALLDIRLHELATMTAMQDAVRALVARLGPEHARKAAEQGGGMALPGYRKVRAFEAYEQMHAEISRGLSDDFDSVFGKRFARAYEKAMQELSSRQKSTRGDGR